jgi:hypothetical protein
MRAEIQGYLAEHGTRYTPEALRQALLDAGFEATEVDAALLEWTAQSASAKAPAEERRRLWLFTLGIHVAVLLAIAALSLAIGSFREYGGLATGILAVVLLVGAGVSGLVGRTMLQSNSLTVALVVPVVSALLIGGSCLAFGGPYVLRPPQPAPTAGTMDLRFLPPGDFQGSGRAICQAYRDGLGFSVSAENLGTFQGGRVGVSIDASGPPNPVASPAPAFGTWDQYSLYISSAPPGEDVVPIDYATLPNSSLELRAAPDGRSGTVEFRALQPLYEGAVPSGLGSEPISGTISWRCDAT